MKGVSFGNYHSFNDWGLILTSKEIKAPAPKIKQIEVEGSDGVLDYTEFFGGVRYNNRSLSFTFTLPQIASQADFLTLFSTVQDAIQGQKLHIILDDDSGNYYIGRVTVSNWKNNKNIGEIVIEADADPWKYSNTFSTNTATISSSGAFFLTNGRMSAIPRLTLSAGMTIKKCGANLFDYISILPTVADGSISRINNGFNVKSTYSVSWLLFQIDLTMLPPGTYTVSCDFNRYDSIRTTGIEAASNGTTLFYEYNEEDASGHLSATFTSTTKGLSFLFIATNDSGGVANVDFTNIMINSGSDIGYKPYEGGASIALAAGTSMVPAFELYEGINSFLVTESGTVSASWQQGGL